MGWHVYRIQYIHKIAARTDFLYHYKPSNERTVLIFVLRAVRWNSGAFHTQKSFTNYQNTSAHDLHSKDFQKECQKDFFTDILFGKPPTILHAPNFLIRINIETIHNAEQTHTSFIRTKYSAVLHAPAEKLQ